MSHEHEPGQDEDDDETTVENRVYLFRELAGAFLVEHGAGLTSSDGDVRARVLRALGDVAFAACLIADRDDLEAHEVARLLAGGPENAPEG